MEWIEMVESGWNVLPGAKSKTRGGLYKKRIGRKNVSTYKGWSRRKGEAPENVAGLQAEKRWT